MEAATKKKRGRPADIDYKIAVEINNAWHAYNPEVSNRAIQNKVNAEAFICLVIDMDYFRLYQFFSTQDGQMKHKGIAEQIGRMMREGLITDAQAVEIAEKCIQAYDAGRTSKEIEKELRRYRLSLKGMMSKITEGAP